MQVLRRLSSRQAVTGSPGGFVIYRTRSGECVRTVRMVSWMPLAVLVALIGLLVIAPARIWEVLLAGWALIFIASTAWIIHLARRVDFDRRLLHSWATVGDRLVEEFSLRSHAVLPLIAMEIEDHSDLPNYTASVVQSAGAWQETTWRRMGTSERRGLYRLGPTTLRFSDPLGFYSVVCEVTGAEEVLVHPNIRHDIEVSVLPGGGQGSRLTHLRSVAEMASVSNVRDYRPGDPVYRIHWPLSVRHQQFLVKEFDRDTGSDIWLVLDLHSPAHRGEGPESSIEYAISWTASLAWHYLQRGNGLGLAVYTSDRRIIIPPVRGAGHIWQFMRMLAPLEGQDSIPLAVLLEEIRPYIARGHSMIVITPSTDPDWLDGLSRPSLQSVKKEVILLDAGSFEAGPPDSGADLSGTRSVLEKLRIPVQIVRREERPKLLKHLRDTLQQAVQQYRASRIRVAVVAALVLALMLTVPQALAGAEWLKVNSVLWWATFLGAVTGYALSRRLRHSIGALPVLIVAGLALVVQIQGQILPPAGPAAQELWQAARYAVGWAASWLGDLFTEQAARPLPPAPAFTEWRSAWERLTLYVFNLRGSWFISLTPGNWPRGQVLLGTLLGLAVWLASSAGAWSIGRRHSAWGLVAPTVSLLAINVFYTNQGWGYLLFAAVASILLLGDITLGRLEMRWWAAALPSRLEWSWWRWSGLLAALAALAMGLTYYFTDPDLSEWLKEVFRRPEAVADTGRGNNAGVPEGVSAPVAASESPGIWPRQDLLGSGPDLQNIPVLSIRIQALPETNLYWRATSYDEYTGRGWKTHATPSSLRTQEVLLWPVSVEPPPDTVLVRQIVRFEQQSRQVYAAGLPVRLSQPAEGRWVNGVKDDLATVYGRTPLFGYEVLSWVSIAGEDDLRSASTDYPVWVQTAYLSLPDDLPERVTRLAQDITADAPTVYDRALALQTYLRQYEYSLDLPQPPEDQDVVDYFLFDLQKGYCDYFATAMVVMARSVGVPARVAVGYASGAYDPQTDTYTVTQADAHSWVEVYFPRHGWIRFEPTPGFRDDAPTGLANLEAYRDTSETVARAYRRSTMPLLGLRDIVLPSLLLFAQGAIGLGIAAAFVVLVVPAIQVRWLSTRPASQAVEALYSALLRWGKRLGVPASPATTPDEFHERLMGELALRARTAPRWSGNWSARLALARMAVQAIVAHYRDGRYSPRPTPEAAARQVLGTWTVLARALLGFWLLAWRRG